VFNQPANLFVAAFIGMPSMNLLEGAGQVESGNVVLKGAGFSLPIPDAVSKRVQVPAQLVAGVRPQSLRMAHGLGILQLNVDFVEYLGTESVLVGKLQGGSDARITAVVPGHRTDLLHKTVALEMDPGTVHWFDKTTGQRIGE
jgi:ABC-type sugar transport system ATPase subunit